MQLPAIFQTIKEFFTGEILVRVYDETHYSRTITAIKNAYLEGGGLDKLGCIWIDSEKLHVILRTDKRNAKYIIENQFDEDEKREEGGKTFLYGPKVLMKMAEQMPPSHDSKRKYLKVSIDFYNGIQGNIPPGPQPERPFVFASYSHVDTKKVEAIIEKLKAASYRVYYDDDIPLGADWKRDLDNRVMKSRVFLAFISESYLSSENCMHELNLRLNSNPRGYSPLVFLEKVELPPNIAEITQNYQHINQYLLDDKSFYSKLQRAKGMKKCSQKE